MAEGGYDIPGENENSWLDRDIDHDGDDDDEEEVDTTTPFQPGGTSTPYHGGEQHEMHTLPHEQSGIDDESIPLLEGDFLDAAEKAEMIKRVEELLKRRFPKINLKDLGPVRFGKKTGNRGRIVQLGPRGGETPIFKVDGSGLLKSFIDKFKTILGPSAEETISKDNTDIREDRQRLKEAEKQEREAERISVARQQAANEVQNLRDRIEETQARIDALVKEHGSNVESQTELDRLKQLKKNLQGDLENQKKELGAIQKIQKQRDQEQAKVDKIRTQLSAKIRERNAVEARLNSTKPLDELNEQETELVRQNEEDKRVIEDENTSPSDREAAEARVAEREEELARLRTQVQEREEALPLRERVKNILKKYGWTLQAVVLAAGIVISAVVLTTLNGLAKATKAIGNRLKELGKKAANALPGMIGSIVSFIFKTAGQVLSFFGKHAWLLILAVVAFLVEKTIKRKR